MMGMFDWTEKSSAVLSQGGVILGGSAGLYCAGF